MPIPYRDPETGRIARDPAKPENPFKAYVAPTRFRDGRSDHRRAAKPQIVVRMPQIVYAKLHAMAESRDVTVTHIVLEALFPIMEPALLPALQAPNELVDSLGSGKPVMGTDGHVYFGLAHRRDRLVDRIKSPVIDPIPPFDTVGRGNRSMEERKAGFVGNLVDKPRR